VSVDAGFGTTSDPAASPLEQDVRALPSSACGPIAYGGNTRIDFMVASDLPLQGPTRASTLPMTRAVQFVLEQHHFRAGRFTVGYQSCDDSTAQTGFADIGKCSTNARAYASDSSVVAVLGPYSSDCAAVEIPIANRASLAMISAQNTNPGLTHATRGSHPGAPGIYYPTGVRTYARIEPADDLEGAGDALFAHRLGLRSAYVLRSNNDPFGLAVSDGFIRAARKLGVRIVGTATWNPGARAFAALAARIARTHPAGVFLGASASRARETCSAPCGRGSTHVCRSLPPTAFCRFRSFSRQREERPEDCTSAIRASRTQTFRRRGARSCASSAPRSRARS
jgi:branched-chain amino acid transport system substrate-binding protein